ncbi:MAG: nucleoside-diphosphate sugar epimerase/dehydratase [Fusicatenibacter sp.]|nr:nucleoside-diphosphate sugar epimerase/dehydratase [Fusicatenibacter sp.]
MNKKENKRTVRIESLLKILALMLLDSLTILVAMTASLWIRFDFSFIAIEPAFLESIADYLIINLAVTLTLNGIFHLYTSLWRFASINELRNIVCAVALSALLQEIGMYLLSLPVPRSYPFMYALLLLILTGANRYSYRILHIVRYRYGAGRNQRPIRTMIVGAGAAGYMIVKEMKTSKHLNRVIPCIIDDNPKKKKTYLCGIPVVGSRDYIPEAVEKYHIEEIVVAIPTLGGEEQKRLLNICQQTACRIKILPGIYQMVNEEVDVSMLRDVQIEDLLGRDPVQLDMSDVREHITGKVILVTGGGGSIGSEICRQVAMYHPGRLIILDIYENNAYDIQNELKEKFPELDLVVLIGSVRNERRIEAVFREYRPEVVYHAAAHKHVPLMEESPNEAIKNNVLGTYLVAKMADRYHARKMVLISTDKAVRPTNIMGASKRICELILQSFAQRSETVYSAVRFGNVLGSNGSVIPLFRKQIEHGGPVTVTHPDIIRYFMTIPEAVSLVLQCGASATGGEIFILDMGEPVRIADLARKMIRLSGHIPDQDIKIVYTGLRPGEKLYEELLIDEKNLKPTRNGKIYVAQLNPVDGEAIKEKVEMLVHAAFAEAEDIREKVQELVPEYTIRPDNPQMEAAVTEETGAEV